MTNNIHEGRNVKRFRELLGIKQEVLAAELGEDWTQKKISLLEQKEIIEPDILHQVAKVLKVPEAAIRNFSDDNAAKMVSFSYTETNFTDCEGSTASNNNYCDYDFHAEKKLVAEFKYMVEEIKRLNEKIIQEKEEKAALYERLLEEMQRRTKEL